MNSLPVFEPFARDVRYAWRVLRRAPAFTLAAVLTLAVAVAINTAVFSVVDAVLLEPLPYPEPQRLALVARTVSADGRSETSTAVDGRTWDAVREGVPSARGAVFSTWASGVNLATSVDASRADARHVQQQRVGAGFFAVLGVPPAIGREFTPEEDRSGGPPSVVLGHDLWRTAFAADAAIVGRPIMLRGAPHVVVGVMPAGFATGERAELWTPLRPSTAGEGAGENYHVILRLNEGATWPRLDEELSRVAARLREEAPPTSSSAPRATFGAWPLQEAMTADLRPPLLILWAAVGVVLVIAAVNLAGLLLARAAGRRREIATRIALGSGRAAVVRQLVVESVVLGALGAGVGVPLAAVLLDGLLWVARDSFDLWQPASVNLRSLVVAVALSAAASLVFGLVPALQASRIDLPAGLRLGHSRGVAGGGSPWPRRALVVAQVALGVMLLASAGLLVRTFAHLRGLDPGFDPANVLTAAISLEDDRYRTSAAVVRLFDTTLARLDESPRIEAAAVALEMPYRRLLNLGFRHADGPEAAREAATTSAAYISDAFFDTLRIPLRRGRPFGAADRAGSPPVAIVNDAFARTHFDGGGAVGRTIRIAGAVREIVGQSGDVPVRPGWGSFGPLAAMPTVYLPYSQVPEGALRLVHGWFSPTFIVRAADPAAAAAALRQAVDASDPMLPFAAVRPVDQVRDASLAPQRFLMSLLAALAAVAVALAAVGIHGLIATTVSERTRELGVRLALGATRARAVRTVAVPGMALAAAGTAVGLGAAYAVAGAMRAFVWGISPTDPVTFAAVAGVVFVVATLATVLPARRILRLDPAATLRAE